MDNCKHNQFGHCKFGECCRLKHVNKLCEDKVCESLNCSLRHPNTCKYFSQFGNCKFGEYCSYSNSQSDKKVLKTEDETRRLEKKIDEIMDIIKKKDHEIQELKDMMLIIMEKVLVNVDDNFYVSLKKSLSIN